MKSAVMKKLILTFLVCAVGAGTMLSAKPIRLKTELERAKTMEAAKVAHAITKKALEAREVKIEKKAETKIRALILKEATRELKKSEKVDVFEAIKREYLATKRLEVVRLEKSDLTMIRRVTSEFCEPRVGVPDGGVTLALLGMGLLGLLGTQRLLRRT